MKLEAIHIYPVKGLGGIDLSESFVERRGLSFDRRWMLVDMDGVFLSQRKLPEMARIGVRIDGEELWLSQGSCVEPLKIPLIAEGKVLSVQVWKSTVEAIDVGQSARRWLSTCLGVECRLVQMPNWSFRATNPEFSRDGDQVSFADGYPVTLATVESWTDLNSRLDLPVPISRFRPNLVISGAEKPWVEDTWEMVQVGPLNFRMAKPCGRCSVVTIDQELGTSNSAEPLKTLAKFRKVGAAVNFSINLIPESEDSIHLGMKVTGSRSTK